MRNLNSDGIKVTQSSAPNLASSRRHFLSAATIVGGLLATLTPARAMGSYDPGRHGGGGPHCFLKGTQILTPRGERAIEDLRIGDLVTTVSGEAKTIKWIGRTRFERGGQECGGQESWDDAAAPIRIVRGAFNGDLPHRDLYVSFGHRFLINGLLIPAFDLVNGHSIVRLRSTSSDVLEYLHIELKDHDVILANGVPAESLEGNAREFDNFDEYVALYGAILPHQIPCAPVAARHGRRQMLRSHLRGVLAPLCDRRRPVEIIQDELARQAHHKSAA